MADVKLPRGAVAEASEGILAAFRFDRSLSRRIADAALTAAFPLIRRAVLRAAARRILLAADLEGSLRCPSCHGKPASFRYDHAARTSHYACGCGREWQGTEYPARGKRGRGVSADPFFPDAHAWTDSYGVMHYSLDNAVGAAQGPASWTSEHDCNPVCGCHLAARCLGCGVCTSCDGCYCGED